jgi:alpha-glucosidase
VAYERRSGDDVRLVMVNMGSAEVEAPMPGEWTVEVSSNGKGEGGAFRGTLACDEAMILR